jgi:hypothetical protein
MVERLIPGNTRKEYIDYMKAEGERWMRVIREIGAKVE